MGKPARMKNLWADVFSHERNGFTFSQLPEFLNICPVFYLNAGESCIRLLVGR